jgi:hypothetical protein
MSNSTALAPPQTVTGVQKRKEVFRNGTGRASNRYWRRYAENVRT